MTLRVRGVFKATLAATAALALAAGCAGGQRNSGSDLPGSVGKLVEGSGDHQLRQVPADQAPRLRLKVSADPHGGWNLHLLTERFHFTPAQVNQEVKPETGHAHLYLDGDKLTRIYSPWYFLSADMLPEGKHKLRVELNANDHSVWAAGRQPVEASVEITNTGRTDGHGHGHGADGGRDHAAPAATATQRPM